MSNYVRNAVVLGLLSALGPFAIDMYLPALPSIAADVHASAAATQMTLTVFFITYGACQIAYGLASDTFGRKPLLYFGLALFLIGSIGCRLAKHRLAPPVPLRSRDRRVRRRGDSAGRHP
ncbi:membrane hypothetical protein [Methylocella tundrae]|uniref:Major facilitator superfamily (MFS) profile domain-containing protein n=1 Tax=Methylocella tundrae TaxID=227605 RepID=A0A8B6M9J6_METTU|nr:membrane hypothetical protein [Methylocella tundrae]